MRPPPTTTPRRRDFLRLAATLATVSLPLPSPADDASADVIFSKLSASRFSAPSLSAVEKVYPIEFSASLARLLIRWNEPDARWWERRGAEAASLLFDSGKERESLVEMLSEDREEAYLRATFESYVASVEVGLEGFNGADGPKKLLRALDARFASNRNNTLGAERASARKRRLALLFSTVEDTSQPADEILRLIGEADDGRVASLTLDRPLGGYANASGPPEVTLSAPPTPQGRTARARAVLSPTGRLAGVRIVDGGAGYAEGERVAVRMPSPLEGGVEARGVAVVSGGEVVEVQLLAPGERYPLSSPGSGFSEARAVTIAPPANASNRRRRAAVAVAEPEYSVIELELLDGGSGYSVDEPPTLTVAAPGAAPANQSAPRRGRPRGYFETLRSVEEELGKKSVGKVKMEPARADAPTADELRRLSSELAAAARDGGLPLRRGSAEVLPPSLTPVRTRDGAAFEPPLVLPPKLFGGRASKPVAQEKPLGPKDYLRFFVSGALCSSTAHTALVPLDVLKTRVQADAALGSPVDAAQTIWRAEGPAAFLTGGVETFTGYLLAGSLSFGLTESFQRLLRGVLGAGNGLLLNTPILILSSAAAVAICTVAVCPFEAVRIRSVSASGGGAPKSAQECFDEIYAQGGAAGFFAGLGPILLKEVPFFITKFVVYDAMSTYLLSALPALSPDFAGPLGVAAASLLGGAVAGAAAALASHPADVALTLTNTGGVTLQQAVERLSAEPPLALSGIAPRLLFGSILVSIQFALYTQLKLALGVAPADLTSYFQPLEPLLR